MDFFKKYPPPFGCVSDGEKIDAYDIDHSGFSTRDEPEYQFARQERENQLADILNRQGIEQQTTRCRTPDSGAIIRKTIMVSATLIFIIIQKNNLNKLSY